MAEEAVVLETPVVPEQNTPTEELTLEQQLEALKPTGHESAPKKDAEPPKPGETGKPGEAAASPNPQEPDPLLTKLDEIKEGDEAQKPQEGKLTPEQQQILDVVPDVQTAQAIQGVVEGYQNLTGAFEKGDFKGVQEMFESWNSRAWNSFLDHIYTTKVASGEWVDRYISEKDPDAAKNPVNKQVRALQQKIDQLEADTKRRHSQEQEQQTSAQQERIVTAYVDHLEGLFNQIDFSKADRRWVLADIHNRVSENSKVRAAINSGNIAAVNAVFKSAVREYVERDRVAQTKKTDKIAQQEQKKSPLQAAAAVTEGGLPDDVKQVPKGQEDNWLDQQLGKLFKKK